MGVEVLGEGAEEEGAVAEVVEMAGSGGAGEDGRAVSATDFCDSFNVLVSAPASATVATSTRGGSCSSVVG